MEGSDSPASLHIDALVQGVEKMRGRRSDQDAAAGIGGQAFPEREQEAMRAIVVAEAGFRVRAGQTVKNFPGINRHSGGIGVETVGGVESDGHSQSMVARPWERARSARSPRAVLNEGTLGTATGRERRNWDWGKFSATQAIISESTHRAPERACKFSQMPALARGLLLS